MTPLWIAFIGMAAAVAVVELVLLSRQRRLLLRDRRRRQFFVRYVQEGAVPRAQGKPAVGAPRPVVPCRQEGEVAVAPDTATAATAAHAIKDEGIMYVDAEGRCTFANQPARDLLHWSSGDLTLDDVLAGGKPESAALLRSLARQGLVEQHLTALAGPLRAPLEISAVALRDRDDNLWGAALFIRRQAAASALADSA